MAQEQQPVKVDEAREDVTRTDTAQADAELAQQHTEPEDIKHKGTEVEAESDGFFQRLYIHLPERSTGPTRYIRDFFTCL